MLDAIKQMGFSWVLAKLTPTILRYASIAVGAVLVQAGFSADVVAGVNGHLTAALGALLASGAVVLGSKATVEDKVEKKQLKTKVNDVMVGKGEALPQTYSKPKVDPNYARVR